MRTRLVVSSLAVACLTALGGGMAASAETGARPAAPSTTIPGMDILGDLGLTDEQSGCLVANIGTVDMNDMTALMGLMEQCGISTQQLLEIGQSTTVPAAEPTTTGTETVAPGELDAATAGIALSLLGLDQATLDCIVVEADASAPADDAAAEAVFTTCGVGPLQLLGAILVLDGFAGGVVGPTVPLPAAASTTAAQAPTTAAQAPDVTTGNAMVDLFLSQLAAEGIDLTPEQGQCILDNIDFAEFDPNDLNAMIGIFDACGIGFADLLPSG